MKSFRLFIEQTQEQEKNAKHTLAKLPKKHSNLIKGFKLKWHHDNTLPGDDQHVGILNPHAKTITVAAPYRYSREFTFLHEIAHVVWEKFVAPYPQLVKKWREIVKNTKNKLNQNPEELFCHGYAATYAQNPPAVHHHPEWVNFIKSLK